MKGKYKNEESKIFYYCAVCKKEDGASVASLRVRKSNCLYCENRKLKDDPLQIFKDNGNSPMDTGSTEGQIALFTYRINHLTNHLKSNKKDFTTQKSLLKLVGKRKSLLSYLKDKNIERYRTIIKKLSLRK